MIKFSAKGDFNKTTSFIERLMELVHMGHLDEYGRRGVEALRLATPVDSGKTANSWDYTIDRRGDNVTISWFNTNVVNGVNIAVILHYGHGTRNGGYVRGREYINKAIQPIFDEIAADAWKEVKSL